MAHTKNRRSVSTKNEPEVAVRLIQQLDGLSIAEAKTALERAIALLDQTQIVSKKDAIY